MGSLANLADAKASLAGPLAGADPGRSGRVAGTTGQSSQILVGLAWSIGGRGGTPSAMQSVWTTHTGAVYRMFLISLQYLPHFSMSRLSPLSTSWVCPSCCGMMLPCVA